MLDIKRLIKFYEINPNHILLSEILLCHDHEKLNDHEKLIYDNICEKYTCMSSDKDLCETQYKDPSKKELKLRLKELLSIDLYNEVVRHRPSEQEQINEEDDILINQIQTNINKTLFENIDDVEQESNEDIESVLDPDNESDSDLKILNDDISIISSDPDLDIEQDPELNDIVCDTQDNESEYSS